MTTQERVKRARAELAEAERELAREEEQARQVVYPEGLMIEVRDDEDPFDRWTLAYSNGNGTYRLFRDVRTRYTYDHVRIPEPPDGWASVRADGHTHVVYWKTGAVSCTSRPKSYIGDELVWTVVPIPPEEN